MLVMRYALAIYGYGDEMTFGDILLSKRPYSSASFKSMTPCVGLLGSTAATHESVIAGLQQRQRQRNRRPAWYR